MKTPARANMAYLPHGKTSELSLIEFPNNRVRACQIVNFKESYMTVAETVTFKVPDEAIDLKSEFYLVYYDLKGRVLAYQWINKKLSYGDSLHFWPDDSMEEIKAQDATTIATPQKQGSKNFGFLFGLIACVIVVYLLFARCTPEQLPCECTEYTMQLVQTPTCLQMDTISTRTVYGCELHLTGGMEEGVIKQVKCR